MSKINLNIDRLILDGVPLSQAESFAMGEAMQAELSRMVVESGLDHRRLSSAQPLAVPPVTLEHGAGPSVWGRQVAQSVYGSLTAPATKPVGGKRR